MNKSLKKTLLLSLMVLTGGFALLTWMEGESSWMMWLLAFAVVLSIYLMAFHPKKKTEKAEDLVSVLSEKAKDSLMQGEIPQYETRLQLKHGETLYWCDNMRTDYYNSKPHLFYLTDKRLICLDDDFRFSHPLDSIDIKVNAPRVEVVVNKKKMAFLAASPDALQKAWSMISSPSAKF